MPKYRQRIFYGGLRRRIGTILRDLCLQCGVELIAGRAMPDHIHLCLSIPPKYSVLHALGFLKGKRAVRIHRELMGHRRMTGLHFWSTGYWFTTVGADEQKIRQYIREQEDLGNGQGDLNLKQR